MWSGHGELNSKKHLEIIVGCKTIKLHFKNENVKLQSDFIFDRRYDAFDKKKKS